jgi:hypothetical protein
MAITDRVDFQTKVRSSMRQLQNDSEKIRSFYQKPFSNTPRESALTYGLVNNSRRALSGESQVSFETMS